MWLSRLDLLAFGRFTAVRLPLGPGFHLVYGPNEAGKSTTLRAIRQLLFGFDERTDDNFVHSNPSLRIGGIVSCESGLELEVIRRKTRKDSLRAADDVTIVDLNKWNELLSGVDETTFRQRYGIDYEQLIEGGRQIATGNGDLGEILFATGSGVTDLNAVKSRLTEEAAEIFKPQGKKQRLNQAIVEWQQQKEQVLKKLLSVSTWEVADRLHQETKLQLDKVSIEWTRQSSDCDRYRLWQRAWPIVRELDSLEQQLAALKLVPRLPNDFGTKRQDVFHQLKQASAQQQAAAEAIQQAERELERLEKPEGLLTRADELSKLIAEWGSHRKAQRDRVNLIEQHDRHVARIGELLLSLGRSADEIPVGGEILDHTRWTRVGLLGGRQAGLVQSVERAESHRDRLCHQLQEVKTSLATMPDDQPLDEMQKALRAARNEGGLETRLEKVRGEISALQAEARQQRERLGLWTGSVDDLRLMCIPNVETIKQSESDFQANQAEQSRLRSRLVECETEHRLLGQQIEELRREFQVPTEADLEIARNKRAEIWLEIRKNLTSKIIPAEQTIGTFEQSLGETDRIADRLRHEADRVAQLAEQLADRVTNESRQHEISVRLAELEADRLALEKRWQSEWPDLGAVPLPPRDMQTWLARRETFLQNEALTRNRENEANELVERIDQNITSLSRFSEEVGLLSEMILRAEERLAREEAAQQTRRDAVEALARLTGEVSESIDRSIVAKSDMTQWGSDWQAAMVELSLAPDSSPDAAAAYIGTLYELTDHQGRAEQLRERISGIDTDARRFEANVSSLCVEAAPDLVAMSIDEAVTSLRDRLSASQRDDAIRKEQTAKRSHWQQQLELVRESRTRSQILITELCQTAGVARANGDALSGDSASSPDLALLKLKSVEQQSKDRDTLEEKFEGVRDRLQELAGEEPMVQFVDQVRQQSPEALASTVRELERGTHELAAERDRLNQELGGYVEQLRRMDGGAEAAEAEEKRQQWLAQIRSDAEQYVRLKLASSVLHSAIERYRDKTRGPVLNVASELFHELTLGSFDSLRVDEDDSHRPVLVGIRSGSRAAVGVDGMSEGTCDQLYLALRLASLQLEAAPRRHLPLIVDDILIQFDDARAAAALRVLAKLAQQRQVIFFTHHEHLLEVAEKHLPGEYAAQRLEISVR